MKNTITLLLAISTLAAGSLAAKSKPNETNAPADPGLPRQRTNEQGLLVEFDRSRDHSGSGARTLLP